jgi:hypothetical protein
MTAIGQIAQNLLLHDEPEREVVLQMDPAPAAAEPAEPAEPAVPPRCVGGSNAPPDSKIKCPICLAPPQATVSTICGHLFCAACARDTFKLSDECPVCRTKHHQTQAPPGIPGAPPPYHPIYF